MRVFIASLPFPSFGTKLWKYPQINLTQFLLCSFFLSWQLSPWRLGYCHCFRSSPYNVVPPIPTTPLLPECPFSLPETHYCFLRKGRDLFCDTPFQVTLPSPGPNCNLCSRNSMIFVQVVGIFLNSIFIYSYRPPNFVSLVFFWEWFLGQEWESVICKFTLLCSYSLAV